MYGKGCCSGVDYGKPNERRKGKGGIVYQIHTIITVKSKAKRLVEALQTDAPVMIWVNSV